MYFFYRWEISDEEFPNMSSKQSWYDIYTLKGGEKLQAIGYNTQADPTRKLKKQQGACHIM